LRLLHFKKNRISWGITSNNWKLYFISCIKKRILKMMKVLHVVVLISFVYLIAVNNVALSGPVRPGTRTCPAPSGNIDCTTVRVANTCQTDAECSRANAGYKCCKQQCGNLACTAPACSAAMCMMFCDQYKLDEKGCRLCACAWVNKQQAAYWKAPSTQSYCTFEWTRYATAYHPLPSLVLK